MLRILKSLMVIVAVAAVSVGATGAYFSDQETVAGNTFTAGSLDLTVDGQNDPVSFSFTGNDLKPGVQVNAGTVELKNTGSLDGLLSIKVTNPTSDEGQLFEPELTAGDIAGQEIDPTGYDANSGDGELWDLSAIKIYFDINNNGVMEWNEPVVANALHTDMTTGSGYRLLLDTNLWTANQGYDGILSNNETVKLGVLVTLKEDASLRSQPQYNLLSNNMTMGDSMSFDLVVGLSQI